MSDHLTPEEERECVLRAQAGDRSARDRLVLTNLGLAGLIAKRRGRCVHDSFEWAVVALVESVETYDPEAGVRFTTYAGKAIECRLMRRFVEDRLIKVPQEAARAKSNNSKATQDAANRALYATVDRQPNRCSARPDRHAWEAAHDVEVMLRLLPAPWRDVVRRRYGIGRKAQSVDEVAAALGKSDRWVAYVIVEALARLRAAARERVGA